MIDLLPRIAPYFLAFIRYLLAVIFFQSSLEKLRERQKFVDTVASYQLLPGFAVRPFGLSLPGVELILALILLSGWQARLAAVFTSLLYLLFIGALSITIFRGRTNIDCGCYGLRLD